MTKLVSQETVQALEVLALKRVEEDSIAKYGKKIVPGSAQREMAADGRLGKITVLIRTKGLDGNYDGNERRVATSDLFQVHHTPEVSKALRKIAGAEKRAQYKRFLEASGGKVAKPAVDLEAAAKALGVN